MRYYLYNILSDELICITNDMVLPHFATDLESDIDNLKSLYGDKGLHHFATDLESDVDNLKSLYGDKGLHHFATDLENDIDIDGENLDQRYCYSVRRLDNNKIFSDEYCEK